MEARVTIIYHLNHSDLKKIAKEYNVDLLDKDDLEDAISCLIDCDEISEYSSLEEIIEFKY